jgi:hypothetical protein
MAGTKPERKVCGDPCGMGGGRGDCRGKIFSGREENTRM